MRRLLKIRDPQVREELRFSFLRAVGSFIMPTYRFSWPSLAWWKDTEFNSFLDLFGERKGQNTDRRWMLYQLAVMSSGVPGDTAECGVYRGAGSYLICKATQNGHGQRTHFLFDSFEGISRPGELDGGYWREGDLRSTLADLQRPPGEISIHAGWIPDKFPDVHDRRFSFVHIDVDLYQPTLDSIEFFYPRMNPGGIIVCDDYGFTTCPGAKKAVDAFLADKPESITHLSCGSAFLMKQPY